MLQSVEGIYQNGKVELLQVPTDVDERSFIVTFLTKSGSFDLPLSRGINQEQAANLRARGAKFCFYIGKDLIWKLTMLYSRGDVVLVFFRFFKSKFVTFLNAEERRGKRRGTQRFAQFIRYKLIK